MKAEIQDKYYYIIKVNTKKKTYFKIGEACKRSRPESLVSKYSKYTSNTAELLAFEKLPRNNKKRLNDKAIHNKLLAENNFKQASEYEIQSILGEVDGKKEFFEAVNNTDICAEVEEIVKNCTKKDYTANVKYVYNLNYTNQKHLVNDDLITKIKENFSEVANTLGTPNKLIILIGQFEPDFVASYAMYNNIIIWHDTADQKVVYKYESLNNKIKYFEGTLEEFIEFIKGYMEENMCTIIDLILSNPPYGRIGAEITKAIIDNLNFKTYINLLPANDYKRVPELWQYQSDMEPCNDAFDDAAVTTHMAKIHKNKVNSITEDEFERSQYTDRSLDKYFEENSKRTHYAIDGATQALIFTSGLTNKTTTIIDHRFIPHKHLAYSKNTDEYKWNVLKSITLEDLKQKFEGKVTFRNGTALNKYVITFNTEIENTNINSFIYSKDGFRFISKIATAVNVDSTVDINKILPKVDWTRSWTVEEILKEYNYTDEEIKEVMEDLKNYKGQDD